jgi:hypothetical protein
MESKPGLTVAASHGIPADVEDSITRMDRICFMPALNLASPTGFEPVLPP